MQPLLPLRLAQRLGNAPKASEKTEKDVRIESGTMEAKLRESFNAPALYGGSMANNKVPLHIRRTHIRDIARDEADKENYGANGQLASLASPTLYSSEMGQSDYSSTNTTSPTATTFALPPLQQEEAYGRREKRASALLSANPEFVLNQSQPPSMSTRIRHARSSTRSDDDGMYQTQSRYDMALHDLRARQFASQRYSVSSSSSSAPVDGRTSPFTPYSTDLPSPALHSYPETEDELTQSYTAYSDFAYSRQIPKIPRLTSQTAEQKLAQLTHDYQKLNRLHYLELEDGKRERDALAMENSELKILSAAQIQNTSQALAAAEETIEKYAQQLRAVTFERDALMKKLELNKERKARRKSIHREQPPMPDAPFDLRDLLENMPKPEPAPAPELRKVKSSGALRRRVKTKRRPSEGHALSDCEAGPSSHPFNTDGATAPASWAHSGKIAAADSLALPNRLVRRVTPRTKKAQERKNSEKDEDFLSWALYILTFYLSRGPGWLLDLLRLVLVSLVRVCYNRAQRFQTESMFDSPLRHREQADML